ncbi:MAG: nicotinate-nucleotide--dimethylbenzimidazole phosphoribosyltransferase [Cytophagales bacterium]|nr:nicotinate-nucleotide--dimethylbenzimidazole phosphoribosyltransferase [Cytophagales bacterium]
MKNNDSEWSIASVDTTLDQEIWNKLNLKTKPPGSLGKLEQLAFQVARIQGSLNPSLNKPVVLVFAGDHGIASSGLVNPYPQEVTHQMVMNFLQEGAAINVFAKVANMQVMVVDSGVNHAFGETPNLVNAKMGMGTTDYRQGLAMSPETCRQALGKGAEIVKQLVRKGTNVIGFGEMGIGNTSAASLIMSTVCDLPLSSCVGKGTGAEDDFLKQKLQTLEEVSTFHGLDATTKPEEILATFGGFEMVQMVGGMLAGASSKCLLLIDGFISTAAFLIAQQIRPEVRDYAVFTHRSEEQGHIGMLAHLKADPLLELNMRLGEGTGCATSYPLLQMAVNMLNDMASFDTAGVSTSTT